LSSENDTTFLAHSLIDQGAVLRSFNLMLCLMGTCCQLCCLWQVGNPLYCQPFGLPRLRFMLNAWLYARYKFSSSSSSSSYYYYYTHFRRICLTDAIAGGDIFVSGRRV